MSTIAELEKEIQVLQQKLEVEKKKQEFDYPFECGEKYWYVASVGDVRNNQWTNHNVDRMYYEQGNVFKTQEEAERERDKRTLLTRFRQFRDKCNGDWKPNWNKEGNDDACYNIDITYNDGQAVLGIDWHRYFNQFCLFGYFKEQKDVERAIELFGDEIKRLWVDE